MYSVFCNSRMERFTTQTRRRRDLIGMATNDHLMREAAQHPDSQPKTLTLIGTGRGSKRTRRTSSVLRSTDKDVVSNTYPDRARPFRPTIQHTSWQEAIDCPYRAELRTREHVVLKCHMEDLRRHIIDGGALDSRPATLLGTKKGRHHQRYLFNKLNVIRAEVGGLGVHKGLSLYRRLRGSTK